MKKKLISLLKTVLIFALTFTIVNELLGQLVMRFVFPSLDLSWRVGIGSFGMPLALLAAIFAAYKCGSFDQAKAIFLRPNYMVVMYAFLIGIGMSLICIGISSLNYKYIFILREWSHRDVATLFSIVAGSIFEEICYRFLLTIIFFWIFRWLPIAVLLQATWFSLQHSAFNQTGNIVIFSYFFSAALLFAITYIRFQSLWVAIALHAGLNTAIIFLYGGPQNYGQKIISEYHGRDEPVMIALTLIASLVLLWQLRNRQINLFSLDFLGKQEGRFHGAQQFTR